MSTLELKLSLIEQLTKIDDEQLLNKIKKLINQHAEKKTERYPAQMTVEELKEDAEKIAGRFSKWKIYDYEVYVKDIHYAEEK